MKKYIAISGSLRMNSFNTRLIKATQELAPVGVEIEIADISLFPLYNTDLETEFPEAVQELKNKIEKADGIIISTPEYNRSISGALKNAIDWISRPWGKNSFAGKPILILGASVGAIGTAVAQSHLKQIMVYLDGHVIGQPEVYIGTAQDKFSAEGVLIDEVIREHIKKALEVLVNR